MKQVAIFILAGLFSQAEGCCFWKSNNKITPKSWELIKVHQRDLSTDGKEPFNYIKVEEAVNKLVLPMVREIHLNQKESVWFGNVSPEAKALYLGLVAKRYNENLPAMEKLEEKITEGTERYRRIIVAPKAHAFHLNRKRTKLPTIFVSPASLENTPEESKMIEEQPPLLFAASSTEQSPTN